MSRFFDPAWLRTIPAATDTECRLNPETGIDETRRRLPDGRWGPWERSLRIELGYLPPGSALLPGDGVVVNIPADFPAEDLVLDRIDIEERWDPVTCQVRRSVWAQGRNVPAGNGYTRTCGRRNPNPLPHVTDGPCLREAGHDGPCRYGTALDLVRMPRVQFERLAIGRFEPVSPEEQPADPGGDCACTSAPPDQLPPTLTADELLGTYREITKDWNERAAVRAAEAALWLEYQAWRERTGLNPTPEQSAALALAADAAEKATGILFAPWMMGGSRV